jgi:hypothetical protein
MRLDQVASSDDPGVAVIALFQVRCPSCESGHALCLDAERFWRDPRVEFTCPTSGERMQVVAPGDGAVVRSCPAGAVPARSIDLGGDESTR